MPSQEQQASKPDPDDNSRHGPRNPAAVNQADAEQRFALARVAHLATVRPEGGPHLVPWTFALVDGRIVWDAGVVHPGS